jgi:hypothetical protein
MVDLAAAFTQWMIDRHHVHDVKTQRGAIRHDLFSWIAGARPRLGLYPLSLDICQLLGEADPTAFHY